MAWYKGIGRGALPYHGYFGVMQVDAGSCTPAVTQARLPTEYDIDLKSKVAAKVVEDLGRSINRLGVVGS